MIGLYNLHHTELLKYQKVVTLAEKEIAAIVSDPDKAFVLENMNVPAQQVLDLDLIGLAVKQELIICDESLKLLAMVLRGNGRISIKDKIVDLKGAPFAEAYRRAERRISKARKLLGSIAEKARKRTQANIKRITSSAK